MNIDKEPILHEKEMAEMADHEKEKSLNNQEKRTRRMSSSQGKAKERNHVLDLTKWKKS